MNFLLRDTAVAFLAGGLSSRMGTPKALLSPDGESFLERQARVFTGFDERLLSANDERIQLAGALRVEDFRPGLGPIGGIASVLMACKSRRVLFVPCDMPRFTMDAALFLLEGAEGFDACIVEVDGRLHPLGAVYAKSALPTIRQCIELGDYRLLAMLDKLNCKVVPLAGEHSRAFVNINTPADLAELK